MDRNAKVAWRDDVVKYLDKSSALFLAQYQGMTVEELTELRRALKAANAEFRVVKNTIAKKAIEGRKEAVIASDLKNQTGIVFVFGDVAAAAKAFNDASKKNEKLKPVAGYMESEKITTKQIEALASLPSREVLIAKILGSLVAPHRGMLGVVQGVPRALVSVLNQIKETKTA